MRSLILLAALLVACDDAPATPDATLPPADAGPSALDATPEVDAWPARPAIQTCKPAPVDFDRLPPLRARLAVPEVVVEAAVRIQPGPTGAAWWVAQADGVIRAIPVGPGAGLPATVLDRRGLISALRGFVVAASPNDAADTHLFVSATRAGRLEVTRYTVWANTGQADPGSATTLWSEADPGGGQLLRTQAGALLLVTDAGISRLDPTADWGPGGPARDCHLDHDDTLWCVTDAAVVRAEPGADFETVITPGCTPTGGGVYRGLLYPELWGTYLYACGAEVRGVRATAEGWLDGPVATLDAAPARMSLDHLGRVYATSPRGLVRLEVAEPDTALGLPRLLSETGCFESLQPLRPTAELVPYEVNSALWTDGAHKRRWVVLPPGETIEANDTDEWHLPVGALLLKDFAFPDAQGALRSVETRVMVRWPFGFSFHTYRWNPEGTEAVLLDGLEAEYADLTLPTGALRYLYPSRQDCQTCHNPRVARVLGPATNQLARPIPRGAGHVAQLEALHAHGVLDRLPTAAPLPDPLDETAPLDDRARAYLHANCAHCHRPDGWAPPGLGLDLRFDTPLSEAGFCDVPLAYSAFGVPGQMRVAAGDPADSNLLQRMLIRGFGQMPLLGSAAVDPLVEPLFTAWITALECP